MKKRIIAIGLFLLLSAVPVFKVSAQRLYYDGKSLADFSKIETPQIYGYSLFAQNLETGTVLYTKNETDVVYPTSCTKLMTAIVVCEHYSDLDHEIVINEEAVKKTSGTKTNYNYPLCGKEHIKVRDMLAAMLIGGANDAANILAYDVGGSIEGFAAMMNEKAEKIGAQSSHFTNPTGLHDDAMVSTASDIACIAEYAYNINAITDLSGRPNYTIEPTDMCNKQRKVYSKNMLIRRTDGEDHYYPNAIGMNVGSTPQGGNCIVAVARCGSLTNLCVIMNSPDMGDENCAYLDAVSVLDASFANFGYLTVTDSSDIMCDVPVELSSKADHITLLPKDTLRVLLPVSTDAGNEIKYEKYITGTYSAPITKGEELGTLVVYYRDDHLICKTPLVASMNIERNGFLYFLQKIRDFLSSRMFIATLVSFVILSLAYSFIGAYARYRKRKRYGRK